MISKLYDKVLDFINKNKYLILIYILTLIIILCPLPCVILTNGGIMNANSKIDIKGGYNHKGSLNLAYVKELKGTIPTYLISLFNKNWERVKTNQMQISPNETLEDIYKRDKLYLDYGNEIAIKTAYKLANKDFLINHYNVFIVYLNEHAKTNLKIGDIVLKIEDKDILNEDEFKKEILKRKLNDKVNILVKRDNKIVKAYVKMVNINNEIKSGIALIQIADYKTNPEIKLNFNKGETGPSGGLMMTLAIYDKLSPIDIIKGRKIVGTGTIEEDGTIGEIGGIKYKLQGAVSKKADIFIAPSKANYQEVKKLKKEKNLKIKIIEATNIEDVINQLKDF